MAFATTGTRQKREFHQLSATHMRLCRLSEDRGKGGLAQVKVVLSGPAHAAQDIATAVCLIADQGGVFQKLRVFLQLFHHLGADQFDGRKGRAQFMRGGGDDTPQIGQLLFARQGHLCRQQRIGHRADFRGDAARIDRQKDDADDDGQPIAEFKHGWHRKHGTGFKSQGYVHKGDDGREQDCQNAQKHRGPQFERRGRNRDRGHDQQGKGVGQAACQIEQKGKLRQIEHQGQHRLDLAQALVLRIDEDRDQVGDD